MGTRGLKATWGLMERNNKKSKIREGPVFAKLWGKVFRERKGKTFGTRTGGSQ